MKNIDSVLEHAEQQCKARGSRLTAKRKQLLAGLIASKKALSAYELVDFCKTHYGESTPAMSAYRILTFLESERLVHKLNLANKYVACAHITCSHDHALPQFLICGNCSEVKEVSIDKTTMITLEETVKKAGYQLVSQQLEMNCLCDNCNGGA